MNNHFLIIVDAQNDFIDGSLKNQDAQNAIQRIVRKILSHGGQIIATADTHNDSYMQTLEGQNLPVCHCIEGTEGWKMNSDIAKACIVQGNYLGYVKKNSFGSLDLPEVIKKVISNFQTLEDETCLQVPNYSISEPEFTLVGFCTDICVISNALILRAAFPNSKITIDSKCCAGTQKYNHRAALMVAKSCQIDVI